MNSILKQMLRYGALIQVLFILIPIDVSAKLVSLEDAQLEKVQGRGSLFLAGHSRGGGVSTGVDFYRIGLDAEIDINFNLKKLQLGCAGAKGQGCDIDINDLSFSGNGCSGPRAGCLGSITRPFIELAIENPDTPTQRRVSGFRLSAENMNALLTAGQNTSNPNGIERFSGYIPVASTSGVASTIGRDTPGALIQQYRFGDSIPGPLNAEQIVTLADITVLACTSGCGTGRSLRTLPGAAGVGLDLPSVTAPFLVPSFTIQGSRLSNVTVNATANLPPIQISENDGYLRARLDQPACVLFLVCLEETNLRLNAMVSGLKADIVFTQDLGFIHKIPVNSPFSLSLQRKDIQWPGSVEVARQGWWMSFQDEIQIGQISPADKIDISSAFPQLADVLGSQLALPENRITVDTEDGLNALIGGQVIKNLGTLNLSNAPTLNLAFSNLPLGPEQDVIPNCYGSHVFC